MCDGAQLSIQQGVYALCRLEMASRDGCQVLFVDHHHLTPLDQ